MNWVWRRSWPPGPWSRPSRSTRRWRPDLLNDTLRAEALSFLAGTPQQASATQMNELYAGYFATFVRRGVELGQLDPVLADFDLDRIGQALDGERDNQFTFLGLQTLYDRYFLHDHGTRYELPQAFFMRVAMGLAIREIDREGRAIEFYRLLSSFDFMSSTPTLFNAGHHPAAAVVLLPDHRLGRSGRHLPGHQAQRSAGQVLRRPRQRLDPGPRDRRTHQGHQRVVLRRGAVPEDRERHRGGGEPGRQAQGRGLRLPGDRGTSTSRSSSTCARTPATTAAAPTT